MFRKKLILFLFLIGLSTSLQAQKPYFSSKDWFYFGVSAGASWDILYDWSFSWNDPIDVDKVGQGIEASLGLSWGKGYENGFSWGIEYNYGYGFAKGQYNTTTPKISKGDDLTFQTHKISYFMSGMIFLDSSRMDFIPAITLGIDMGFVFQGIYKGRDFVALGISPMLGLRAGFSAIVNQDYQIDVLAHAPVSSFVSHHFGLSVGFKRLFW